MSDVQHARNPDDVAHPTCAKCRTPSGSRVHTNQMAVHVGSWVMGLNLFASILQSHSSRELSHLGADELPEPVVCGLEVSFL